MERLRWSARLTLLTAVLNTLHLGAQAHLSRGGGRGGSARMSAVANTVNSAEVLSERRVVQLENTLLAENSRRTYSDSAVRSEVTEITVQCNTKSIKYHKY